MTCKEHLIDTLLLGGLKQHQMELVMQELLKQIRALAESPSTPLLTPSIFSVPLTEISKVCLLCLYGMTQSIVADVYSNQNNHIDYIYMPAFSNLMRDMMLTA